MDDKFVHCLARARGGKWSLPTSEAFCLPHEARGWQCQKSKKGEKDPWTKIDKFTWAGAPCQAIKVSSHTGL